MTSKKTAKPFQGGKHTDSARIVTRALDFEEWLAAAESRVRQNVLEAPPSKCGDPALLPRSVNAKTSPALREGPPNALPVAR